MYEKDSIYTQFSIISKALATSGVYTYTRAKCTKIKLSQVV